MSKNSDNQIHVSVTDIQRLKKMSDEEIKELFTKNVVSGILNKVKDVETKEDKCIILWKYRH